MKYIDIKLNGKIERVLYFLGKGNEKPRADYKTEERHSVVAIIKNDQNEYLCIDAKNQKNCRSFVMGGIEPGETPEQAALREITEETGYCDIAIDCVSNFIVVNHFFAAYKNVNRYAYIKFVYGHLKSNARCKILAAERAKQKTLWVKKTNLAKFLSVEMCQFAAMTQ